MSCQPWRESGENDRLNDSDSAKRIYQDSAERMNLPSITMSFGFCNRNWWAKLWRQWDGGGVTTTRLSLIERSIRMVSEAKQEAKFASLNSVSTYYTHEWMWRCCHVMLSPVTCLQEAKILASEKRICCSRAFCAFHTDSIWLTHSSHSRTSHRFYSDNKIVSAVNITLQPVHFYASLPARTTNETTHEDAPAPRTLLVCRLCL